MNTARPLQPQPAAPAPNQAAPAPLDNARMLNTLLANVDGMVYRRRLDSDWTMEFVSQGCLRVTGHQPADILHNKRVAYDDLTLADDRLWVREAIRCAVAEFRSFDLEYRIVHADGSVRWVWERGTSVIDVDGRPIALEGLVQDITKRKSAETMLREAERRYHGLFDNAIEGIFRTTVEGNYLDANPALAHIYGFDSPQELMASLRDIGRQLYVEPQRREEFMRIVKARGSVTSFESQVYRKNGDVIWISENSRLVLGEDGRPTGYEGTVEDITERRLYQARIERQANYDTLTGLANRSLLQDRLEQALLTATSFGTRLAVAFVDLDRFKYINDSLGHHVGDELLKEVAARVQSCVRECDTVARLGGDEFVLLINGHSGPDSVQQIMERMLAAVSSRGSSTRANSTSVAASASRFIPEDGADARTLLKHADSAMYRAKDSGRDNFQFFHARAQHAHDGAARDGGPSAARARAAAVRVGIPAARRSRRRPHRCSRGPVALAYSESGHHSAAALHRPGRGNRAHRPHRQMGVTNGLRAKQGVAGRGTVPHRGVGQRLGAAISPGEHRPDGRRGAAGYGPRAPLPGARAHREHGDARRSPTRRHARPAQGAGCTDRRGRLRDRLLQPVLLETLSVDRLKIDRSFVEHIASDADDATIVRTIIALGHNLGLKVVAEGVESEEQLRFLRSNLCDEAQGFLMGRPVSSRRLRRIFTRSKHDPRA